MKKLLSVLVGVCCLIPAMQALAVETPSIKLNWRMDLLKEDFKGEGAAGEELKFVMPYIRLDIKGKFKDDLTYRAKFRLNKTLDKDSPNVDDSGKGLDYAYIEKKVNASFKVRVGKQVLYHGGWDAVPSSKDEYVFSETGFSYYAMGVGAFYNFYGQELILQALNTKGQDDQKMMLYGGALNASLMAGLLKPIISFHILPDEGEGKNTTFFSVGNRISIFNFFIDTDYNHTQVLEDETADEFIGRLTYKIGNFRPQIKYAHKTGTGFSRPDGYSASYGDIDNKHVALEYYPYGDDNFRIHGAYIEEDDSTDVTDKKYILGMAGNF